MHNPLRPFVPALYGVGVIMMVIAFGDYAGNVWPFRPDDVNWRYGAVGIVSGFLVTPTFGWLLVMTAAAVGDHRRVLKILGVIAIVVSAALLATIALFALDALEVRQNADAGRRFVTAVSSTFALVKIVLVAAVLLMVGLAGLRAGRTGAERASRGRPGLVVGGASS